MIANNSLPPQNIEAEESILGGILLDPEAISRVIDLIMPEAFYVKAHREIYQAARQLHSQGKPTDLMTVTSWLQDHHLLEQIGGTSKLAQLVDPTVSAVNIDRYAALVLDKYLRRQLIAAGHEIVDLGFDTTQELEIVLDESEKKIFRLTQKRPQEGLIPLEDTLIHTFSEIEKLHQNTALPGIPCSFYDLDAMTGGFQRSDLIIIAGRPSMGKCLAANSEIVLADGSLATIEEIYNRRQGQLLTLKDDWKFALTEPSNFINDGIKPVFRVTTKLGRYIETTLTHPYLTVQGWQKLSELKPGDKIAIPRQINIFGIEIIPEYQVKLLAYFIGDGCLTGMSPQFTNSNPLLQEDFIQSVTNFKGVKIRRETSQETRTPSFYITGDLEFIRTHQLDIWEKNAHKKTIPSIIFNLQRSLLTLFLNRLFSTDGWVSVLKSGQIQLGYGTVSEKLAHQIQHLLLRFGIISNLKKHSVKYNNHYNQAWQLDITDAKSISIFIEEIGIFGKEKAIDLVKETLVNKKLATSEIYWDKIVSIEYIGEQQVYDLTIPDTHNFVANDICVHNTSFALNIAHNIAKENQVPIAIFSLEMSKEQLALRLLASEAAIESNRLRSGRLSQPELEKLFESIGTLSSLPIFIDDASNITVMQMRSQVRRLQAEKKGQLGLVLIDYLQLMEGDSDNRVQEISKITRSLKGLAREINVPVIALSQLSRGVESRTNKRPMMSDLRESGSIEQDADLIIMLYRDEYYNQDSPDRGIAEVIVTKHRNGPTGIVKLLFQPELTKFLNLQTRQNY